MSKKDKKVHFIQDTNSSFVNSFRTNFSTELSSGNRITDCAVIAKDLNIVSFNDVGFYGCNIIAKGSANIYIASTLTNSGGPGGGNYFYMYSNDTIQIIAKDGVSISYVGLSDHSHFTFSLKPSNDIVILHSDALSIYTTYVSDFQTEIIHFMGNGDVSIYHS